MNALYIFAEYITTAVEILVYFGVLGLICDKRLPKQKSLVVHLLFVIGITCITRQLNEVALYSYITGLIWIVMVSFSAMALFKCNLMTSISVGFVYLVFVNAMDFLFLTVIELLFGVIGITVEVMTSITLYRCIFALSMKFLLILMYYIFAFAKRKYSISMQVDKKTCVIVILSAILCFFCMQNLIEAVVVGNMLDMRRSVLIAWLFVFLFVVSLLLILKENTRYLSEKTAHSVLKAQLEVIEQDNRNLNVAYSDIAKLTHDFKNHLNTISMLSRNEKNSELLEYLNEVTSDINKIQFESFTGIDSVDAVINNKRSIAREESISLEIDCTFLCALKVRHSELCSIVANLLDNAIEASLQIENIDERKISLSLSVINSMFLLKCVNSYKENTVQKSSKGELLTMKDDQRRHGYGMQIVKTIAEKNNGLFEYQIEATRFTSIVMLPLNS